MRTLANFVLFQLAWFAAVAGADAGSEAVRTWAGPLAVLVFLAVHLAMIDGARERTRELVFVLAVGLVGGAVDSVLRALAITAYPTSTESALVPPWIASLWVAFAMLPRFSLAWLRGRPVLAGVLGAIGGPLSYLAGTRFGAVAVGSSATVTWVVLAVQYATFTPLILRLAPASAAPDAFAVPDRSSRDVPVAAAEEVGP